MTLPVPTRALLLLLAAAAAAAQSPAPPSTQSSTTPAPRKSKARPRPYQPPYNPNVIVLDPAHGGQDNGAGLGSDHTEKDFNFAFAERLRTLLTDKGFTVVFTHQAATDETSPDQRAELANRARAVACLILHASNTGRGLRLFTSSLTPAPPISSSRADTSLIPWDSAQAASLPLSLQLANELSTALNSLKVPLIVARASVAPVDSLSCPAVILEVAPQSASFPISNDAYQQHIAEYLVTALTFWRQHAQDQIAAQIAAQTGAQTAIPGALQGAAAGQSAPQTGTPAPRPKPRPKPVIITAPDETPLDPGTLPPGAVPPATRKPAPVERRPPDPVPQAVQP